VPASAGRLTRTLGHAIRTFFGVFALRLRSTKTPRSGHALIPLRTQPDFGSQASLSCPPGIGAITWSGAARKKTVASLPGARWPAGKGRSGKALQRSLALEPVALIARPRHGPLHAVAVRSGSTTQPRLSWLAPAVSAMARPWALQAKCTSAPRPAWPNLSLNRTRYGRRRKPGPRHMVHHRVPGLRRLPPRAG